MLSVSADVYAVQYSSNLAAGAHLKPSAAAGCVHGQHARPSMATRTHVWKRLHYCCAFPAAFAQHLTPHVRALLSAPLPTTIHQVSAYDFSKPGWSSSSGLFSQMVWRDTRAVGCAFNRACPWAMYVCHYSPPGALLRSPVFCLFMSVSAQSTTRLSLLSCGGVAWW
jgi:hypothetical protein